MSSSDSDGPPSLIATDDESDGSEPNGKKGSENDSDGPPDMVSDSDSDRDSNSDAEETPPALVSDGDSDDNNDSGSESGSGSDYNTDGDSGSSGESPPPLVADDDSDDEGAPPLVSPDFSSSEYEEDSDGAAVAEFPKIKQKSKIKLQDQLKKEKAETELRSAADELYRKQMKEKKKQAKEDKKRQQTKEAEKAYVTPVVYAPLVPLNEKQVVQEVEKKEELVDHECLHCQQIIRTYEALVMVTCTKSDPCHFHYHKACWSEKRKREYTEKCWGENCTGFISSITMIRNGKVLSKEMLQSPEAEESKPDNAVQKTTATKSAKVTEPATAEQPKKEQANMPKPASEVKAVPLAPEADPAPRVVPAPDYIKEYPVDPKPYYKKKPEPSKKKQKKRPPKPAPPPVVEPPVDPNDVPEGGTWLYKGTKILDEMAPTQDPSVEPQPSRKETKLAKEARRNQRRAENKKKILLALGDTGDDEATIKNPAWQANAPRPVEVLPAIVPNLAVLVPNPAEVLLAVGKGKAKVPDNILVPQVQQRDVELEEALLYEKFGIV